jgi:TonB family protein
MIQWETQSMNAAREVQKAEQALAKKPDDARLHLRKAFAMLSMTSLERRVVPFSVFLNPKSSPPPDDSTRQATREAARKRYEEIAESFEKYLSLKPQTGDREFVLGQLEALRYYSQAVDVRPGGRVFNSAEVETKAVIYSKPEPSYTEEARRNNVSGIVRLRAVVADDGEVKYILVIMGLPHGLTQQAMAAARAVRFKPATVDGKPVAQYVVLEYNFNIY